MHHVLTGGREQEFAAESKARVFKKESKGEDGSPAEKLTLVGLLGNQRSGTQLTSRAVRQSKLSAGQPVTYSNPPRFAESNLEPFAIEVPRPANGTRNRCFPGGGGGGSK